MASVGEASLSRWFLTAVVSASKRSVESTFLGWMKSAVGRAIKPIASSDTLCICWSYWMRSLSSAMLANNVGKFLGDSTYSELP